MVTYSCSFGLHVEGLIHSHFVHSILNSVDHFDIDSINTLIFVPVDDEIAPYSTLNILNASHFRHQTTVT